MGTVNQMSAPAGFPEWPLGCTDMVQPLSRPQNQKIDAPAGLPNIQSGSAADFDRSGV